jgi:hypothetical protein
MTNGYVKSVSQDPVPITFPFGATVGRISGHSRVVAVGHTPTPAANTDCWEGANAYPLQAAATKLEILSASANDAAAGTGARTFVLNGLDTNFNPISETLTMNGTTPVLTVNSYLRVNSLQIASAGSGNTNAGDVTLRVQSAGATQAIARAGYGFAKQCIYTVPTGFSLLVTDLLLQCGGTGTTSNIIYGFTRISPSGLLYTTNEYVVGPLLPIQRLVAPGVVVPQQTTLTTRITAVTGAPTSGYSSFEGILIDNTQLQ